MLEANCHEHNAFVTLTYDDEHLPVDGSVDPVVLQLFMKKLRFAYKGQRLRFYGVGEYGERTGRPHYHVAVFGMRTCDRGISQVRAKYRRKDGSEGFCCEVCDRVRDLWSYGNTFLGQLELRTAAYVAGYVTKTIGGDGLGDRHPPFSRMSNRPGIGCFFMDEVASDLLYDESLGRVWKDVPRALKNSGKKWPLGKYLRRQLRKRMGRDEKAPKESYKEWDAAMQPLRDYAKKIAPKGQYYETLRGVVQDLGLGRRLQLEGRQRRMDRRKVL